ncbi:MAG: OstA-like protein [Pelobium sp.]
MRKYLLFLFVLLSSIASWAQQGTRVQLVKSETIIGIKRNGEDFNIVRKPVFTQDNATLTCDSAYYYSTKNTFEAFGNVHINQADTVNIYSDHLNYDGNTKTAILTNNVKLTDNDAVLTTNNLDYNLGTKIGRYSNGGKIVNGKNTLISQNGYYFTESKDAFFRYKVQVKSPDVLIKSDTLKYNTISKIAYFFGPTNIYGKTDTLYTENGQYNTTNDQAAFGKKNLYTQGSKSLKGDSLFYDGKAGYGRAVKNIIFIDTAQKVELRGELGVYRKKDESVEVTKHAYVVFITEKDSTQKDSVWMTADTLRSMVLSKMELYALQQKQLEATKTNIQLKDSAKLELNLTDSLNNVNPSDSLNISNSPDSLKLIPLSRDSIASKTIIKKEAKVKPKEELPKQQKNGRTAPIKLDIVKTAPYLTWVWPEIKIGNERSLGLILTSIAQAKPVISLYKELPPEASDTTRIRIINAYHKVKIFKSDLQARADSAFFSYGDSIMRMYQKPVVWAEGSQISADTMYLQMKNKKLDNMDMIRNAIVVNTEKDSSDFNQIAGKLMKGYFKSEKLDVVFVNGNAESIYFPQDSSSKGNMMRSIASRMRIDFDDDSLLSISFIRKPEHTYYPLDKITEELRTLPNFNWKPKDRPKSKEEIINGLKEEKKPAIPKKAKSTSKEVLVKPEIDDKVKQAKPALIKKKVE